MQLSSPIFHLFAEKKSFPNVIGTKSSDYLRNVGYVLPPILIDVNAVLLLSKTSDVSWTCSLLLKKYELIHETNFEGSQNISLPVNSLYENNSVLPTRGCFTVYNL